MDLFQKNIDTIKFPKPWVENALKENFVDKTEFQKKFSIEDQNLKKELDKKEKNKNKNKLLKIFETKLQKNHIKEQMEIFKNDIQYYQEINEIKPVDIMRFPERFSVDQAIEYSEEKLALLDIELIEIQKNINVLNS